MTKLKQILNVGSLTVLATVIGLLSTFLGAAVIVGWYAHLRALIQIHSTFAPMQYNTTFCFVLSGWALVAAARGQRRAAVLLFQPYVLTRVPQIGRMAPMAATCFSLLGLTLVGLIKGERRSSNCAWPVCSVRSLWRCAPPPCLATPPAWTAPMRGLSYCHWKRPAGMIR
jgi:hypothetical protein